MCISSLWGRINLAGVFLGMLLLPPLSLAATYYVATSGSGTICSLGSPCGTLDTGISKLASGDTLYLRGGTYTQRINSDSRSIPSGSSWGTATTISAYPGETVILNHSQGGLLLNGYNASVDIKYIVIANIIIDPQNSGSGAAGLISPYWNEAGPWVHHVRLLNMEIRNAGQGGSPPAGNNAIDAFGGFNYEFVGGSCHDGPSYCFYINGKDHVIDGMTIYNMDGYGIHAHESNCGSITLAGIVMRNNTFFNVGGAFTAALTTSACIAVTNPLIYNNVIYSNPHVGIEISANTQNAGVYNNTVYNNSAEGINVFNPGAGNPTGTVIQNNIVYANGSGIVIGGGITVTQDHNLTTNPTFVNSGTADFHLQSTSAARDAGTTVPAVTTDKDGVARPQGSAYDIGAYELGGGIPPAPQAFRVNSMN